jgi:hypothetical protein
MKKITLFLAAITFSLLANAATGWFNDFLTINVNGVQTTNNYFLVDASPASGATALQGKDFGVVTSLEITGCDMSYWSDTQDRTGGSFFYKITNTANNVDLVSPVETIWDQAFLGGNNYQGTKTVSINVLAGLPYGSYKLQVWAKSWGGSDDWLSNGSANYVATFTIAAPAGAMSGPYTVGTNLTSNFISLSAAVTAINTNGISSDVTLSITSSITEPTDISLGVNTGTNKLTIKPAVGVSPTITFQNTGASVSIDGHFVIGSPNALNTNLISTNNVVIDGSNTVDGTTKDLTFVGSASSVARSVFRIFGNCDGISIKNCIITTNNTSATSNASIQLTDYTTLAPDNFTALNNTLNASSGNGSLGALISVSGTPTALMTGIKIQNNIVASRATRAIMFNYVADGEISGNTITHDLQLSTGAAQTIAVMTGGSAAGTFNIFNNKITQVKTWNTAAGPTASNGAIGIDNQLAAPKIVNIYNNYITGFTIASASVQGVKIYGIRHIGGSTSNIYHNTIVIPEMTDMTTMTGSFIAGIAFATAATTEAAPSGTMIAKNNIIISNETGMKTWGIRRVGTGGTFTSDHNVIYCANTTNGFIGYFNASDVTDLAAWKTASSQDANSKSVNVFFTNAATGDLSLTGTSVQDNNLSVPRLSAVLKDITGNVDRSDPTYAGAYESTLPFSVTALENTSEQSVQIMRTASGIEANFAGQATVELYTINGMMIDRTNAYGKYTHDLNAGIYIISINGKATKFIK